MKKFIRVLLCAVMIVTMSACSFSRPSSKPADSRKPADPDGRVSAAVLMPNQSQKRWIEDAAEIKKGLEELGCQASVYSADDDAGRQADQIKACVEKETDCLIIAAVDSGGLIEAEDAAKKAGIPVIAYDRLLMNTDAVSFYAAFDQKGIGYVIGNEIVSRARLDSLGDGEYKTIEFFAGPGDGEGDLLLYEGLMEVLQPYLDAEKLICRSKKTSFEEVFIPGGAEEAARRRCDDDLDQYYEKEDLDICAAVSDSLAYGCRAACIAAGYTEDSWPLISGQGCELEACRNILEGTQAFSVYKDTAVLARGCVQLADAVLKEIPPQITDMENYHNGRRIVPAYTVMPSAADQDNLEELLVDSGCYTKEQLEEEE